EAVVEAVRGKAPTEVSARVDRLLDRASVTAARRPRAHEALLDQLMGDRLIDVGWTLGVPPSASFATQLRDAGVFASARIMMAMQFVQQMLALAGWWLIGRGALDGQIASGWLVAWALVLF